MPDTGLRVRDGGARQRQEPTMGRPLGGYAEGPCRWRLMHTTAVWHIRTPEGRRGRARPLKSMPRLLEPARGAMTEAPKARGTEALGARLLGSRAEGSSEQGRLFVPRAWWAQGGDEGAGARHRAL